MRGQRKVKCMSLQRNQGVLTLPFRFLTKESLVEGGSSVWWPEDDDIGYQETLDHSSKTRTRPWQSFRRWSPLQRIQGNLGLRNLGVCRSTLSTLGGVIGWDLVFCLFFFFLIFLFFFFLSTWILALQLSTCELREKRDKIHLVKKERDQHEVDALAMKD